MRAPKRLSELQKPLCHEIERDKQMSDTKGKAYISIKELNLEDEREYVVYYLRIG